MATATTKSAYAYTDVRYTATRVSPTRAAVKFESRTRFADVANGGGSGSDGNNVSFFSFYVAAGLSINDSNWKPNLTPSLSSSGDLRHSSTQSYKTGCEYNKWLKHDNSMIYEPSWMPNNDYITFVDKRVAVEPSDTGVDFQFALIRPDSPSTSAAEDLRWFRFTKTYTDAIRAYNDPTSPTITSLTINNDNHAAFNRSGTKISVSWEASKIDSLASLSSYSVSAKVGSKTVLVGTTTSRSMTFDTDKLGFTVASGTTVTVLVRAKDSFDRQSSSASNTITLKAYSPTAPSITSYTITNDNHFAFNLSGNNLSLSWSASSGGSTATIANYIVTYKVGSVEKSFTTTSLTMTRSTSSLGFTVAANTVVSARVTAVDNFGSTTSGSWSSITLKFYPPPAPTAPVTTSYTITNDNHLAFSKSGNNLSLSWSASSGGSILGSTATIANYIVTYKVGSVEKSFTTTSLTMTRSTSSLGFTVAANTVVSARVTAVDNFGSTTSGSWSSITLKAYRPTAPTVVTATPNRVSILDVTDPSAIEVSWEGATGVSAEIAGYRLVVRRKRDGIISTVGRIETKVVASVLTGVPESRSDDILWFNVITIDEFGVESSSTSSNAVPVFGAVMSVRGANRWDDGIVYYHNGTAWREAQEVLVYDGSSWRSM